MSARRAKIVRDLTHNPARTALVVAALAVGLTGLSTTMFARAIFTTSLDAELAAVEPSSATIVTGGAGNDAVAAVADRPDVDDATGRQVVFGRIDVDGARRPLRLVVVDDLGSVRVDRVGPERGSWPPPTGSIALERSSVDAAGLGIGDVATITDPDGGTHQVQVSATAHDLAVVSGRLLDQVVYAYTSTATWAVLGQATGFDEIAFTVTGDRGDVDRIRTVADEVGRDLERLGLPVLGVRVPAPGRHVLDNVISSLLLILGGLGALSLVLSGFLIVNTVSATLARQRSQIGIMKAVGASRNDVLALYLATVAANSALALALAVPAGALAARILAGRLGTLLNIDTVGFAAPWWVWTVLAGAGLGVPLAAAIVPVLSGTRLTVAETIRNVDTPTTFGGGRFEAALGRLPRLPTSVRYATRNIVRRKGRLALTVVALSLGGAILVTVLSLRSSLLATVEEVAAYWQQDVTVDLQRPLPLADLEPLVATTPGAADLEGWLVAQSSVVGADGRDTGVEVFVFGVPPRSRFLDPTVVSGSYLRPGDGTGVVVNVDARAAVPGLSVGDDLTVRAGDGALTREVIGVVTTQLVSPGEPRPTAPIVYVARDQLASAVGAPGAVNRLAIAGTSHTASAQTDLAHAVDARLRSAGVAVRAVDTHSALRSQVERLTTPVLLLLVAMAVLFAVVGGLGLLGTMSLNVLERTSEFGVVRAVGGTGRTVLSIVVVESLSVAALSWALGAVLAVPFGWVMAQAVGISFIKVPLVFRFAPFGVALWLVVALVVATLASWLPARAAARISVRDAIAYE